VSGGRVTIESSHSDVHSRRIRKLSTLKHSPDVIRVRPSFTQHVVLWLADGMREFA
jgi:hypothetical protein